MPPSPRAFPWRTFFRWSVAFAILFFVARVLFINWNELSALNLSIRVDYLLYSAAVLGLHFLASATLWHRLTVLNHASIPLPDAISAWAYSILGKYVPGKIFLVIARAGHYSRHGIPSASIAVCCFLELLLQLLAATAIFAATLPLLRGDSISGLGMTWFAATATVLLVLSNPRILERISNAILQVLKKEPIAITVKHKHLLTLFLAYILNCLLLGAAFLLLVRSVYPVDLDRFLYLTSSFLLASWIGIFSLITPGGLGVREGVLFVALQAIMPAPLAAGVTLLARLWATSGELAFAGLARLMLRAKVQGNVESS